MMSELIYSSAYLDMHYEKEHNLILYVWHDATKDMLNAEYQKEHLEIVRQSEKYGIAKHLIDTRHFFFSISVDLQEWAGQHFYPPLIASGSKKFSLVLPSDVFAQASIEQTIDEGATESVIQTRYFDDMSEARQWVLE